MGQGGVNITIEDTMTGKTEKFSFASPRDYRLVYIGSSGVPRSIGKAPFKAFRRALQDTASKWAEEQYPDRASAAFELSECRAVFAETGQKGKPGDTGGARPEAGACEDRGDRVAWRVLYEFLTAVLKRWSWLLTRPLTVWEFGQPGAGTQDQSAVRDWLFGRR